MISLSDAVSLLSDKQHCLLQISIQMTQQEFHRLYELESEKMFRTLNKLSDQELLTIISKKGKDAYHLREGKDNYQIWQVIRHKGNPVFIMPLFEIVKDLNIEYLVRYHACDALFSIAGIKDEDFKGQVQYGLDKDRQPVDQQKAIERLESVLSKFSIADIKATEAKKPWWKIW